MTQQMEIQTKTVELTDTLAVEIMANLISEYNKLEAFIVMQFFPFFKERSGLVRRTDAKGHSIQSTGTDRVLIHFEYENRTKMGYTSVSLMEVFLYMSNRHDELFDIWAKERDDDDKFWEELNELYKV